ncbi:MAG: phosphatase PAP2 family protein [Firmicutes bacterium]|nr:phosphatase PAP2 family protein [Bacillota bacterium]
MTNKREDVGIEIETECVVACDDDSLILNIKSEEVENTIEEKGNQTIKEFGAMSKKLFESFMQNKKKIIIFLSILAVICIALVVVASIWDYQIAHALNNPYEWYSWFLQDYGEWVPAYLVNVGFMLVLFVWLVRNRKKDSHLHWLSIIPLTGALTFGYLFTDLVLTENIIINIVVNIVMISGLTTVFFFIPKNVLIKILFILMIGFIISNLVYFLMLFTKWLWGRVRFRDIGQYLDPDIGFTNWFIINGPNGNEAFFSGHVLAALSTTFAWLAIPVFKIRNKFVIVAIFLFSAFYVVSMMYGRIVTGAHYLSDVTFSVIMFTLFNLLGMVLLRLIVLRKGKQLKK